MYTKEKLESKEGLRLYRYIGNYGLKTLIKIEETLAKSSVNRDLNINLNKESFVTRDNSMHYTNTVYLNNDGTYLISNITKTKGINLLDISLELGKEGYDYSTGERYQRRQAKVEYIYENDKIELKNIEDELFYNELEEKKKNEINKRVISLKK